MPVKCRACNTAMVVEKCEISGDTTTCWHECPLCKHVRLTSERCPVTLSPSSDDEMMYTSDSELLAAS